MGASRVRTRICAHARMAAAALGLRPRAARPTASYSNLLYLEPARMMTVVILRLLLIVCTSAKKLQKVWRIRKKVLSLPA